MKRLIAGLVLALLQGCATLSHEVPKMVAQLSDGVTVSLYESPCSNEKVLKQLKPEFHKRMQNGLAQFPDREVKLCWGIFPEFTGPDVLIVVDEEENHGPIPLVAFKPKEGV